jgi:hypothetical protein
MSGSGVCCPAQIGPGALSNRLLGQGSSLPHPTVAGADERQIERSRDWAQSVEAEKRGFDKVRSSPSHVAESIAH